MSHFDSLEGDWQAPRFEPSAPTNQLVTLAQVGVRCDLHQRKVGSTMKRTYNVPLAGVVTVDDEDRSVHIEVDIADISVDLKYDEFSGHSREDMQADGDIIRERFMDSPMNLYLSHTMTSNE